MNRISYKAVLLWFLHGICLVLLMGVLWTFYRYAANDFFANAVRNESYESTRTFEKLFLNNINNAIEYAQLESKFETKGRLNLNKVVETDKGANNKTITYCLQDALDFGRVIGIVFNEDNQLVVLKTQEEQEAEAAQEDEEDTDIQVMSPEEGGEVSVYIYDNYGDLLSDQTGSQSRENNTLLSLLYRLSDYYNYRKILGLRDNGESNFVYRLVHIDESGKTLISTNMEEGLDSNSLMSYGSYYWYDSKTQKLETNCSDNFHKTVLSRMNEKERFQTGVYELMVAVDTAFPARDSFSKSVLQYQNYTGTIHRLFNLTILILLGMLLSFFALAFQVEEKIHRVDDWYTEVIMLICFVMIVIIYWGIKELAFAFKIRYLKDFITGMILIVTGYIPLVLFGLSLVRKAKSRCLISGLLTAHMMAHVEKSLRRREGSRRLLYGVLRKLAFQMINVLMITTLLYSIRRKELFLIGLLILLFAIWNLLYLGIACKLENQQRIIFDRISDMTRGKVGEKLDSKGMSAENRELADMVNALDDSLEKAVQSRTRSERMQTELIANVSHDLRTPLTSILSYVELLRREITPEGRAKEYLQVLQDKANRLKSLAEALMEASRATSGTLTINWINIDFVQMVNQIWGEFYDRMEDQRLQVVTHFIDPPAMIRADGKILWRILENLFSNVCKYAMPGSKVYIDIQETPQSYVFTMKNLSARKLTQSAEDLTERFIRGDVARSTEGTGLGLSIVKNMTEQLHGKFELFLDGDYFRARLVFPKIEE